METDADSMFILPEDEAEMAMLVDSVYPSGDELPAIPSTSALPRQSASPQIVVLPENDYQREEMAARRMNELTQKYLTGRLPFSEYLKTLESQEGNVDEEGEGSYDDDDDVC